MRILLITNGIDAIFDYTINLANALSKKNEVILINLGDQSRAKDYKIIVIKKLNCYFSIFTNKLIPLIFLNCLNFINFCPN